MANDRPTLEDVAAAKARRMTGTALQLIEDAPMSAESVDMFECGRWSHYRCLGYIADRYSGVSAIAIE